MHSMYVYIDIYQGLKIFANSYDSNLQSVGKAKIASGLCILLAN